MRAQRLKDAVAAVLLLLPCLVQAGSMQELGFDPRKTGELAPPAAAVTSFAVAAQQAPTASFKESETINQQWKAPAPVTLGGIQVSISGLFGRDKERGYLVLYSKSWGKTPLLFNLKKLVSNEAEIAIGDTNFRIYVDPQMTKSASMVKIERSDGKAGGWSATLGQLMKLTYGFGKEVRLNGKTYHLFLVNEVDGKDTQGKLNRDLATVVLLRPDVDDEYAPFTFNYENLSDQVRNFPLEGGHNVGLRSADGTLEVYER